MRCPRCGNDNPGTNRFCGMCGATLLPAPAPVTASQTPSAPSPISQVPASAVPTRAAAAIPSPATPVSGPQNIPVSRATAPPREAPRTEERPTISGPSFLGLNDPPPRKRGSLSIDPHSAPASDNLDYLLEHEEPPKRGAWKFILIVVVLALAGGLGYLRWKNQGFGWLSSGPSKPAATTQPSDTADSNTTEPPSGSAANPSAAPAASQPAADAPSSPANPPSSQAANPAPDKSASAPTPVPAPDSAANPTVAHPPATKDSDLPDPNIPVATPAKPRTPVATAHPAPAPVAKPAKAFDPVSEAQKYLYGKGVRQDCDRGLQLLKPAADHANPKAMIEMGALYSAGLCTPRDLPTAYRWFAIALRKDPDNQSVQTDLQKLWGEMTQPERQLAIKLSQ